MNLSDLAARLDLRIYAGEGRLDRPIGGGYAGDLLSDVMAHGRKDDLWITIQVHPNIVAVAVIKELAAIVISNGREPAAETVEQAEREGVPVLGTPDHTYELAGRLHGLGVKGS
jgi:hypothetical protein